MNENKLRVVAISDTHNFHDKMKHFMPDGDVVVHAGDFSGHGEIRELKSFLRWFSELDYPHKIFIAGNHDFCFENNAALVATIVAEYPNVTYLQDSGTEVQGVKFWGSPWQPWFYNWAFNIVKEEDRKKKWDLIPEGTDVLITHGPAYGVLDFVPPTPRRPLGNNCGCKALLNAINQLKIKFHVSGHIHEGYGVVVAPPTTFINASICDVAYEPNNAPIIFDVEIPESNANISPVS